MRILIIGAGQHGYYLSKHLKEAGHDIRLIDRHEENCARLANAIDVRVFCGDGTKVETLAAAGAGKCDVMIAVTNHDENNLIACEIGKKQFGIQRTISKINNTKNISLMKRLGIDLVLDSTQIIADLIEREIDNSDVKLIADISNSDAIISEYTIPETWKHSGKRVMDLEIPENCVLIYILRAGSLMIPRGNTLLMAGDNVVALAVGSAAKTLKKLFEL